MSELQDALERIGGEDYRAEDEVLIRKAARRVANLDIDAATKLILTQSWRWVSGYTSWEHASDQQKEAARTGARQVAAALGITTETTDGN